MADQKLPPNKESEQIQVENFNGLNLLASQLNIPYENTPNVKNCTIDPGGSITKRGGSALLSTIALNTSTQAVYDVEYQSPDGYNFILRKLGRDLYVYQLQNDTWALYANGGTNPLQIAAAPVWAAGTQGVRFSYCTSSETSNPRIFLSTGIEAIKVVAYNVGTAIFSVTNFAPTGAPANWAGTNYPRALAIWDGRLYAAGTPNSPATIWISKAGNFDNFTAGVTADDGFAISLYGQREQRITGLQPYRHSLVVFTRRGIFAVQPATFVSGSGSSAGVVTPTNIKSTQISSLGAVNSQCITPVENTIHFVSDTGIYELIESTDNTTPYQAGEISLMVSPIFRDIPVAPLETAIATYDYARRTYWVALPGVGATNSNKIYAYKVTRKAWTEYDLGVYSKATVVRSLTKVYDTAGRSRVILVVDSAAGDKVYTLSMNSDRVGSYLDFVQTYTGDGATKAFTHSATGVIKPSTVYTIPTPATNLVTTGYIFDSYQGTSDLQVTTTGLSNVYTKVGDDKIELTTFPLSGDTITVTYICPNHVEVYIDNVRQDPSLFTINGDVVTLLSAPANNSVVKIGITYPAYYDTYELNFGSIRNLKRLRYMYVFCKDIEDINQYVLTDVNASSGQVPADILFQPVSIGQLDVRYWKDGAKPNTINIADIYYDPAGVWDKANWDQVYPAGYSGEVLKLPLTGICKFVQFRFYSKSRGVFIIPGYQLDIRAKGRR